MRGSESLNLALICHLTGPITSSAVLLNYIYSAWGRIGNDSQRLGLCWLIVLTDCLVSWVYRGNPEDCPSYVCQSILIFSSSQAPSDEACAVKLNTIRLVIHNITYREVQVDPSLPLTDKHEPVLQIRLEIDVWHKLYEGSFGPMLISTDPIRLKSTWAFQYQLFSQNKVDKNWNVRSFQVFPFSFLYFVRV